MSDLDAIGNPEHKCGATCEPHEPLTDRDLETLNESVHIDSLYAELNLVREHAALVLLTLARMDGPSVRLSPRSFAVLLDLSETEAECLLGQLKRTPAEIVDHAVKVAGEDGYIGQAMAALFRLELFRAAPLTDGEDD